MSFVITKHILLNLGHTRELRYIKLQEKAFSTALLDNQSGLTHAALIGARKQSVRDAEKLLSYSVVNSMEKSGYTFEANYVRTIAQWHEACDGKGLAIHKRSEYNKAMFRYIVEDLMPSNGEYNFTALDINRLVDNFFLCNPR